MAHAAARERPNAFLRDPWRDHITQPEAVIMTPEVIERMVVVKGDITELQVDAIVNTANEMRRGGVDGAIHDADARRYRT